MYDLIWNPKGKIPVAMTIAGSDSGGGAGIAADLKTFASLGVHGAVAITAVTAQNTLSVSRVQALTPDIVEAQIVAVAEDIGIDAAKTGMLYSSDIVETVAKTTRRYSFPLVVDPVMMAKSGASLLLREAVNALKEELLPVTTVITPNIREAELLSGHKICTRDDMVEVAKKISELGPKAVVVKGGHLPNIRKAVDVLYHEGDLVFFEAERIHSTTTHGTGCCFSAAITAELAKGASIVDAVKKAKEVVTLAIRFGLSIGKGFGPVNPMAVLYREATRYSVLKSVEKAMVKLKSSRSSEKWAPEVGINIVEALPYAIDLCDVVGVPGRLRATGRGLMEACPPDFGASSHVAKYVLTALAHDARVRAAMNVRFSEDLLKAAEALGFSISYYDRRKEPLEVKTREGMTIPWGMKQAIMRLGRVPDIVYHKGDWGKEPMIVLLGRTALDVVERFLKILQAMNPSKKG